MIRKTERQKTILKHILDGASRGAWLDVDELIDRLGADCTKQAIQCSIRFLEGHGLLVREYVTRRGRRRMILVPTVVALTSSGVTLPSSVASFTSP